MNTSDWNHLRSFLSVAEEGSFSAAARALGQSQPTIGRHIEELEQRLGVNVFRRDARGQSLTDVGAVMVEEAKRMRSAVAAIELAASGQDTQVSGTVRITASVVVSHFVLPKVIAQIRAQEPGIQIELVPSDTAENLLYREADIALRMYRPEQLDIVASHIADLPTGLFASDSYLEQRGEPIGYEDLADHDLIGFDKDPTIINEMKKMGVDAVRDDFPVRTDDQAAYWHLVRAGCGIGAMQLAVGEVTPGVHRILHQFPLPDLPLWLATPTALRNTPRIRRVLTLLADAFRAG